MSKAEKDRDELAAKNKELAGTKESLRKLKEGNDRKDSDGSTEAGKSRISEINKEVAAITHKEKDMQAVPESVRQELGWNSSYKGRNSWGAKRNTDQSSNKRHLQMPMKSRCKDIWMMQSKKEPDWEKNYQNPGRTIQTTRKN